MASNEIQVTIPPQLEPVYSNMIQIAYKEDEFTFLFLHQIPGKKLIEATVTDDRFVFDSPAVYEIDNPEISRVLSFTHTYTGQAFAGELIQAQGIVEQHGKEKWLVVGTTREAKGEFIRSLSLLEQAG